MLFARLIRSQSRASWFFWIAAAIVIFSSDCVLAAPGYRSDRILVQPKPGVASSALASLHFSNKTTVMSGSSAARRPQVLAVAPGADILGLVAKYRSSELVEFAEPDYIRQVAVTTPNDPKYVDGTLWGLNNFGQSGGTADADVDAPEAWDVSTSAVGVVVAVLDSGIRYTHEDLAANMWRNPIDGSYGWNALTGTNDPVDSSGHGTLSAGVLGAVGNNGKGVVGVAWQARIMACACFDSNGNAFDSDIIACLDYARTNGAKIINASWGSYTNSAALSNAIYQLREDGILVVAAAGNNTRNIDVSPYYPAAFKIDNVVSVAYTTRSDLLGTFSNYGATNVHLAAPGAAMYSTFFASDNSYLGGSFLEGTSLSAPMVSGALALIWSQHPTESHQQVIGRLLRSADPLPALAGRCVTGGRLNLSKALNPPILLTAVEAQQEIRITVSSEPGRVLVVEAATDLAHWRPVYTNTISALGSFEFTQPFVISAGLQFYRAVAKP